nr:TPR repeat protein [uncultured bacterium]
MEGANNAVFISYRQAKSAKLAHRLYDDLTRHGFDVFLDVVSLENGKLDKIIMNQIAARAHFLSLLSPGSLERCSDPEDMVRREIEEAIRLERNIVPVLSDNVNFYKETGHLSETYCKEYRRYMGVSLTLKDFPSGIEKLRSFLKEPNYDVKITPTPAAERREVEKRVAEVARYPAPSEAELTAEEHTNRGYGYYLEGNLERAYLDFNEAIRLNPKDPISYYNRGNVRQDKGDIDGAIADMDYALKLNPKFADGYNNRGYAYQIKGNLKKAMSDYDQAIKLDPRNSAAYSNRGGAKLTKNDNGGAIKDFDQSIRFNPNNSNPYHGRGVARRKKRDRKGALSDFQEALRLNPNASGTYFELGVCYFEMNQFADALRNLELYLQMAGAAANPYAVILTQQLRGFVR